MTILERLRGGLIVSCQADADSLLNTPDVIALFARVAVVCGAAGVRVEGIGRLRAVRDAVDAPLIGILKRAHPGFEPYITSTTGEVESVLTTGADVVAFDATLRPHPEGAAAATLVAAIHAGGALAMADCSDERDVEAAAAAGAEIVATTLAGYTPETHGRQLPALDLTARAARLHPFVICEGGIAEPGQVRAAFAAGASAVVVGTALTNLDARVRRFVAAARDANR